jgi:hypothetical protein
MKQQTDNYDTKTRKQTTELRRENKKTNHRIVTRYAFIAYFLPASAFIERNRPVVQGEQAAPATAENVPFPHVTHARFNTLMTTTVPLWSTFSVTSVRDATLPCPHSAQPIRPPPPPPVLVSVSVSVAVAVAPLAH